MQDNKGILTAVNNESVVQQVINQITDAIISGQLKPGDKLPAEMELISTFQVSRNSLRSAIQTLRAYGVLEVRRPEGTFVCEAASPQILNPMLYNILLREAESFNDVVGLRDIIDIGISKMIISNGLSAEDAEILEQSYAKLKTLLLADDYNIQAITDADMNFHKCIAQATHNSLAMMLNEFLLNLTSNSRYRTVKKCCEDDDRDYLVRVHRQHLDALEAKPGVNIEEVLEYSKYYWKNLV